MKVNMRDIRKARMCSKGARAFFKRHNLNWDQFLGAGIDSEKLLATNDSMAIRLVEVAKSGRQQ